MNLIEKATKFRDEFDASKRVAKKYVLANEIPAEEMNDLIGLYDDWKVGLSVKVGERYRYENKLYEVIQTHTTQEDWTPSLTPSLFKDVIPTENSGGDEIIADWKQPTGAHDAYKKGDKVNFEGKVYESLIDNNTWSPKGYPQGWKEI